MYCSTCGSRGYLFSNSPCTPSGICPRSLTISNLRWWPKYEQQTWLDSNTGQHIILWEVARSFWLMPFIILYNLMWASRASLKQSNLWKFCFGKAAMTGTCTVHAGFLCGKHSYIIFSPFTGISTYFLSIEKLRIYNTEQLRSHQGSKWGGRVRGMTLTNSDKELPGDTWAITSYMVNSWLA